MLSVIRKIIPRSLFRLYHKALAYLAAWWYGQPSEKLVVVGVTGTNGKSTTVNLIARVLEATGAKVGFTSSVNFKVGEREWLNPTKMTMLGRFGLQKLLREMVRAGCRYAVIETSSEGLAQSRHLGVNYDVAVFLNLTPEHIESHGSFENYKRAKGELFRHLTRRPRKKINGQEIKKVSVVNLDDEHAPYFLEFPADEKWIYAVHNIKKFEKGEREFYQKMSTWTKNDKIHQLEAVDIVVSEVGSQFVVGRMQFELPFLGGWNVSHALAAIAVGQALEVPLPRIRDALASARPIPGRMELIDEGQPFTVIVDYAPQPQSVRVLYEFLKLVPHKRLIHMLGSAGGGRDKSRRPILGRLAGEAADIVIVTNEDPYDEDPMEIVNAVAHGALECGKKEGETLFRILDRREAIRKAISLAQTGDLVLLTGKGAEQAIVVANRKKIHWDEREEVKRALSYGSDNVPLEGSLNVTSRQNF